MAKHANRVRNLTRNCSLDRHQAEIRIEAGTCVWVERNISFRELTLAEVLELRAAHRESGQPSPYRGLSNELPGLIFEPPAPDKYKFRERWPLLKGAAELLSQFA